MPLLNVPQDSVIVRMYRIGHGDCFLIGFPRKGGGKPYFVMIDCGYKPGSEDYAGNDIKDIIKDIEETTGKTIDLFIITHEHQDHLNGITTGQHPTFKNITIKKAWFAWTENPKDPLANDLRAKYKDQLLELVESRRKLALAIGSKAAIVQRMDNLLSLEFGGTSNQFNLSEMRAAASDPSRSRNKKSMKYIKDRAQKKDGIEFRDPDEPPIDLKETNGIKVYILGPPKNNTLLGSADPIGREGYSSNHLHAMRLSFNAAVSTGDQSHNLAPFGKKFQISKKKAFNNRTHNGFFKSHYGKSKNDHKELDKVETSGNASWRRIDADWLYHSETLALKRNRGINNTSLVVAFELPETKKVLLFAADAQRGNWISWDDQTWNDQGREVTAKDLLSRTVLYKVGHHGSHNATLKGRRNSNYPNLSWMGQGVYGEEFTAMITAVTQWAVSKNDPPWRHPLPSIKRALGRKAQGRVFQTDTNRPRKPSGVDADEWRAFTKRCRFEKEYFDLIIKDKF